MNVFVNAGSAYAFCNFRLTLGKAFVTFVSNNQLQN